MLSCNRNCVHSDQYDFQQVHSVVACLLKCTNDWYLSIYRGKFTVMTFINLKKAFDTIGHHIPLDKMQYSGIDGLEHQWSRSCLHNLKQCCRVDDVISDTIAISTGVPQGFFLGPSLSFLYINDLPFTLSKAHATMYANAFYIILVVKIEEINTCLLREIIAK